MYNDKNALVDVKKMMIARYPRFATQIASANLEFRDDLTHHTAATDGKNIYFDPDFFASLSNEQKLFLIAHELMHIKFEHMYRLVDKNGENRDMHTWNVATDAIINANLEKDGFEIQEGAINMPEALKYTAEEFYDILMRDKNNQDNQNHYYIESQDNQNDKQSKQNEQNQNKDDHSLWEKAFEDKNNEQNNSNKNRSSHDKSSNNSKNLEDNSQDSKDFDEKSEFEKNRQERREQAKKFFEKYRTNEFSKINTNNKTQTIQVGNIGKAKAVVDWKLILGREFEKTETIWSQRRSIAENNYAYRLEEYDIEDEAETEVMIDTSGSISDEMVKTFLRQLKPLLKHSKLKVGFFADYSTESFQEIKTEKDIERMCVHRPGCGTNPDAAIRAFSKKREVNKIVFTDGWVGFSAIPKTDLKNVNVIWLVYENRDFSPCCGKVIQINSKEFSDYDQDEEEHTF